MPTYNEKLRDPRWLRMRLEIMSRDAFACRKCLANDKTLNVHHLFYDKTCDPWDYPAVSLVTLCVDCHSVEHESKWAFEQSLIWSLRSRGAMNQHVLDLALAINRGADASYSDKPFTDIQWQSIARAIQAVFSCAQAGGDVQELSIRLQAQFPTPDPS